MTLVEEIKTQLVGPLTQKSVEELQEQEGKVAKAIAECRTQYDQLQQSMQKAKEQS